MQTAERLNALMDHLGLEAAFFATQVPGDVADLAWGRPERIKGLVLCVPMRLDARPFKRIASRLLLISGELGLSAQMTLSAQEHLPETGRHILQGYNAEGWSDVVADRTAEVADTVVRFLMSATEQETSQASLALRDLRMQMHALDCKAGIEVVDSGNTLTAIRLTVARRPIRGR